jgi:AsmA protein
VEVPSVGRLLAWLGRPLGAGQPDPGPLTLGAELTASAAELGLRRATLEGKAAKLRATGTVDASREIVRFEGDVDLEAVDLDAYLPAREAAPRPAEAEGQGAAVGWSEEPFELGTLGRAAGRARARIGEVRYRGLPLREGVATLALAGGVLTAGVDGLRAAGGTIAATATVDASRPTTALAYRATISGVQARPVLQALAGTDRLSGTAAFEARGEARGRSQKELVGTLGGDGRFRFRDGAVHGVNIAAALRRARTLGLDAAAGEAQKTDFAELGGSFVIADGVVETRDLHLQAPLLQLDGGGRAALPPRTLDYQLVAKLVGTLEGQDGREAALVGLPIPIRVTGSFDRPAYGVDWESVFREAAKDPARLLAMPQDLRKFGRSLGVDLPAPGRAAAERVGKALEAAPGIVGGEGVAGAAAGVLNRLAKPGTTSRPAEPETRRAPGEPAASDVVKGLAKGLLGN